MVRKVAAWEMAEKAWPEKVAFPATGWWIPSTTKLGTCVSE